MHKTSCVFATIILLLGILSPKPTNGEVTVDPHGTAVAIDLEGEHQSAQDLTLSNHGDEGITYGLRIIPQEIQGFNYGLVPSRDGRGGPDDATYEWRDDEEDDCPVYNWIDISEFEDVVDIEEIYDDTCAGEFEFGFTVEYYGNEFDQMTIFPNGMVILGEDPGTIQYFYPQGQWQRDLPTDYSDGGGTPTPPPNLICVAYQDLNPTVAGNIYFWTDESQAICTWQEVPHFQDANAENDLWTFQVIINSSGLILFQYAAIGIYDNADIMIGFQNEDRDMGFTIMRNDFDYLEAERIIAFGPEDAWITWVTVDPTGGEIGGGEEAVVELLFDADEVEEEGLYYAILQIDIEGADQPAIEIPLLMSVNSPVGSIAGTITDPANQDEPIEGAPVVLEQFGMLRIADEEGRYEMNNIPVGGYDLSCYVVDYLPCFIEDIEVEDGETANGSMALLHAECNPSVEVINIEVEQDSQEEVQFEVSNRGNGTLTYRVERSLEGGADAEPWDLRQSIPVSEIVNDSRLEGAIFVEGHFFVSGANIMGREDSTNMIYVLNPEGEFVRRFEQVGESSYGMRDMAWDGALIWGSGEQQVYGFNTEGDSITSFEGPEGSLNALAWDPDRERLWITRKTGNTIYAYDADGNEDDRLRLGNRGLRPYGLAYWSDDPDGYTLYIYHDLDGIQMIYKMNPADGDTIFVQVLEPDEGGRAGGAFITNEYDPLSWVLMTLVGDADQDRLNIWQLEGRRDWMSFEPNAGEIPAEESVQFTFGVNAQGFPPLELGGNLTFIHDGVGGETNIPFNIHVLEIEENEPPSAFNLLQPANNDTVYEDVVQTFSWERSIDPDSVDNVSYRLWFMNYAGPESISVALADTFAQVLPDTGIFDTELLGNFSWWVEAISIEDTVECNERFDFILRWSLGVNEEETGLPKEFAIQSIYPNPFNAFTRINYSLNKPGHTLLKVYDFLGREMSAVDYGYQNAGWYRAQVDASNLPSGIYIVRLLAGNEVRTAKLLCIK